MTHSPAGESPITALLRRAATVAAASVLIGFAAAQGEAKPPTPPPAEAPAAAGAAQNPQGPTPRMVVDAATDTIAFSMNEANGMEVVEFIKWAQEVTGKRFVFNAGDIQTATQAQGGSTISFLGTFRIKRSRFQEDFFAFFQTMLYIKSLALVPRGEGDLELLEIVSMNGARSREVTAGARYVPLDDVPLYRYQAGVPILSTYQLKHINAQVVTTALRPFYAAAGSPQGGGTLNVNPIGNSSAMLMQGYGPQVYSLVEILKLVDVPTEQPNIVVQVIQLEFQAPEELEPILTEVLESRQRIRQQVLQEQAGGQPGAVPGGSGQAQLKVVVHSSQKAVVLSGTAEQVRDAQELIARLDVPSQPVDGAASVVQLKNVLAEDLADTLRNFLQEDNQAEQQAATPAAGAGASAARRTRRTVIRAHKESNSLLVSAAGTKWTQIQELIAKIDQRQRQVLIEAALVELTTGDLDRLGVELGLFDLKENGDFTRGFGYTSFGQSSFEDTDDDGIPDSRLPDFDNPLQGVTGGIISGGDFAVPLLINALSTDDRANILSLPSVLVNNNESATVVTGEERPTTQSQQGTATTNQSVGTPREAGITLEISPTISPNNYLRLNVNLEVSRFVGAFDPNSVTGGGVVLKRQIKTQVTMPSDSTMVIGGVIEDQESDTNGGIPLLKDIPILGYLFSKSENTSNKTNLYFFVTPTILDEDDFSDLYKLSLDRKLQAEEYIGERRLRIVDRAWKADPFAESRRLEDTGSTIEDLDALGENETVTYSRNRQTTPAPSGPSAPRDPNGAQPR